MYTARGLGWHIGSFNATPAASFVGSGHSKLAAGVALNDCANAICAQYLLLVDELEKSSQVSRPH